MFLSFYVMNSFYLFVLSFFWCLFFGGSTLLQQYAEVVGIGIGGVDLCSVAGGNTSEISARRRLID
jgi:hypothetical protein